jgi:metal-responsive CopG/Arc/MetJ family transcriptional regulator
MRTIIDIPDEQVLPLAEQCRQESISRSELIRRAIALYLEQRRRTERDVFGLWRERQQDAVEYQRSLRAEWGE